MNYQPKTSLKLPIFLMVAPTALLIVTILAYAIVSFIFYNAISESSFNALDSQPNLFKTIINIIMFLVGAISTVSFLPGLIVGIVVLVKRLEARQFVRSQSQNPNQ